MRNATASDGISGIGVLDKAVTVLQAVAAQPCNLAELCAATGLPRATAHRLAVGLECHHLIARDTAGRWLPGPALRELAGPHADEIPDAALAILPRLHEITGESVQIYRRDGAERLCVAAVEPPSGLRDTVPVGSRLPMTAGSAAKVLLAWAPDGVRAPLLDNSVFAERTLADVRKKGWAQSIAERAAGVASVSVPVRDADGEVVAAISVSGPIERIGRRPGVRWAADLLAAATALQERLAHTPD